MGFEREDGERASGEQPRGREIASGCSRTSYLPTLARGSGTLRVADDRRRTSAAKRSPSTKTTVMLSFPPALFAASIRAWVIASGSPAACSTIDEHLRGSNQVAQPVRAKEKRGSGGEIDRGDLDEVRIVRRVIFGADVTVHLVPSRVAHRRHFVDFARDLRVLLQESDRA